MTTGGKYLWTKHSLYKIRHYGLSQQRIKRIVRYPTRTEEAIIPKMIAAMSPCGRSSEGRQSYKYKGEIWTIYQPIKKQKIIKIITAWRYPGKSPVHNPIPQDILDEIKLII